MDLLSKIKELKEKNFSEYQYIYEEANKIADKMEEEIGKANMWSTLRPGFTLTELLENLEYIARENDL